MSDSTTHLLLPYLLAAQAQKHVTHNEALRILDGLVQLAVLDRDLTTPPASPADGARYIVGHGGTGAWSGWDLSIAYWVDGAWMRLVPREGWLAWVADEDVLLVYGGSGWTGVGGGGGVTLAELGDGTVSALGVNTGADTTNRLAVRSNTVLFTAINAGDGGNGDMRYVVNKETPGDTASFLFQTSWSGRAEIGTVGSDAFALRMSADGETWIDGFTFTASGHFAVGHTETFGLAGGAPTLFQVQGNAPTMGGIRWGDHAIGSLLLLMKSRGSTPGALGSPLQNGDTIASFIAAGDAGGEFQQGAQVFAVATGDWGSASGRSAELRVNLRHQDAVQTRLFVRSDGRVQVPGVPTTASGANAFLDSANQNNLLRSTSSERYKRDIEPVEAARSDAILALEPIWYRSTAPADRPDWSWYGLVAEEVAKIEPRLVHYGYREDDYELVPEEAEDGAEPSFQRVLKRDAQLKPDGVQYDRLAVLLLDIIKRQEARIAALEARLAQLVPRT